MSAESLGTKGQPHFSSSGAPQIDVDPTSVADYAALVGNHIIGTTTQRTAGVVPGTAVPVWVGLLWEDTTDGNMYKCIGTNTWRKLQSAPFAIEANVVNIVIGTVGSTWNANVSFTSGTFTQPPIVQATHQLSLGPARKLNVQTAAITTSGFQVIVSTGDGTNPGSTTATIGWTAIQMTPAAAAGAA
jgi:hypothetical protein